MWMSLIAASSFALVMQDQVALRAAPRDSALQQTSLFQGDMLEVRGSKLDYLQVYDHRHERAGYIKAQQVRQLDLNPELATEYRTIWRYLREQNGAEASGIAYLAAYLKLAPASAIDAEVFDALGGFAERLARRASARLSKSAEQVLAGNLETAAYYGVQIKRYERDGKAWFCYDGEAYRRVLAMTATAEQQARAALALTRQDCVNPAALETERQAHDVWRAEVLDRVKLAELTELSRQRIKLRQAAVWSALAFQQARKAQAYQAAGSKALQAFMAVKASELSDEEQLAYHETALRVAASRWASMPTLSQNNQSGLSLQTQPGANGETCVQLTERKAASAAVAVLAQRCTYGVIWLASQRQQAGQQVLTVAVQTLEGWRELWLWHKPEQAWLVDVIPPANTDPDLAYVDFAGWIPGSKDKLLLAREARIDGRIQRSFEVFHVPSLRPELSVDKPRNSVTFSKWQDSQWLGQTLSLR